MNKRIIPVTSRCWCGGRGGKWWGHREYFSNWSIWLIGNCLQLVSFWCVPLEIIFFVNVKSRGEKNSNLDYSSLYFNQQCVSLWINCNSFIVPVGENIWVTLKKNLGRGSQEQLAIKIIYFLHFTISTWLPDWFHILPHSFAHKRGLQQFCASWSGWRHAWQVLRGPLRVCQSTSAVTLEPRWMPFPENRHRCSPHISLLGTDVFLRGHLARAVHLCSSQPSSCILQCTLPKRPVLSGFPE